MRPAVCGEIASQVVCTQDFGNPPGSLLIGRLFSPSLAARTHTHQPPALPTRAPALFSQDFPLRGRVYTREQREWRRRRSRGVSRISDLE